jgi:hypothetical protein
VIQLGTDLDDGLITRDEWTARRARLTARVAEIDAALAATAGESVLAPFAEDRAGAVWDRLDNAQRRAVIRLICDVIVHPAGRGARVFDPDTVEIIELP